MTDRKRWVLLVGLLVVAFNFRPAITSLPPLIETIRVDVGLSYTAVSLLTTIPTALIGLFAFVAAPIARRLGRKRAVFWAVVLITASTGVRLWGTNAVVLFGSTVLVGAGIAVGQALLPAVVLEHFSDRAALITGVYTASLGLGAAVAAGGTALLAEWLGSWPGALALWALPGALAAAVFFPAVRFGSGSADGAVDPERLPWLEPGAWIVAVYFGVDVVLYFAQITWLAPLYVELGWNAERAGLLLTVFILAQVTGSLSIPAVADRWDDRRPWLALSVALNAVGLVGFLWYPFVAPWAWALLAGLGVGGLFALILTLPVDLAADASVADRLTPMMLGVGYLVGSVGPVGLGWIRDARGSYGPAFAALLGLIAVLLVLTVWFSPDRVVS